MCLVTNTVNPKIAEHDILVYKILQYRDGKYYAPYSESFQYKKGKNTPIKNLSNDITFDKICGTFNVHAGWLHSYNSHAENAIFNVDYKLHQFINSIDDEDDYTYVVALMLIPKGAKYYKSINDFEYCSDSLVWHGIVLDKPVEKNLIIH